MNRDQEQSGGEGSTNLQAGRDVHLHGLTVAEARQIAIDVFKSNAIELQGVAQAAATARAESLTNEFFAKIQSEMPDRANQLADPDMQSVFFDAQREYARSGEDDLRIALVDLLAARSKEDTRNLRTLALNEAILSAAKLTEQQRRAIAWIFYLGHTRDSGSGTPDAFYTRFSRVVAALGTDVPLGQADYQHIEYVGAGSISMAQRSFASCLYSGDEGLFSDGFEEDRLDPDLRARLNAAGLIVPAVRNPAHVQIKLLAVQELEDQLSAVGLADDIEATRIWVSMGRLQESEILQELDARIPETKPLRDAWDDPTCAINSMTLTSVGIAIGHAYWSRLTGDTAALSIWL